MNEKVARFETREYTCGDSVSCGDFDEWISNIPNLIANIIGNREFVLYTEMRKIEQSLCSYATMFTRSYQGIRYRILCSTAPSSFIENISEDSDFRSGNHYLIVGDISDDAIQNFVHYLNFQNKTCYFPPIECIRMDNDGESLFWSKPDIN